ncbi:hypothetical protein [Campylobacter phage CJLB-4]|nr:hypothetical protein [Campylobacter phage CJLB-4]
MVLVTCNRALAQGDFCLLALIFCHQTCRTPEKHKASQSSAKLCVPPTTTCITSKKIAVMSNDAADFFSFTTSPHPACIPFRHNCSECLL